LAGATAMPCGSPSPGQLKRRLSMLKQFAPFQPRIRNAAVTLVTAFALVGLVPLRVVPTSAAPIDPARALAPESGTVSVSSSEAGAPSQAASGEATVLDRVSK